MHVEMSSEATVVPHGQPDRPDWISASGCLISQQIEMGSAEEETVIDHKG